MSVPGPVIGPCEAWITGDDVAACCSADPGSAGAEAFDDVAEQASAILFELSGRVFAGLCETTVRPCRDTCACWGASRSSGLPFYWTLASAGLAYWRNECGDKCGCGTASYVKLAGYPVREVTEVKIDGAIVDPSEYRLDGWRRLIRMADPGPPVLNRRWPSCQNLALDDDQPGTFSISYRYGTLPPSTGVSAAAQLACELWKACPGNEGECRLPSKVTKVVRQGITIEKVTAVAELLRSGSTGLPLVDAFLAQVNPGKVRRRAAVFSPDLPRFPRRVGN